MSLFKLTVSEYNTKLPGVFPRLLLPAAVLIALCIVAGNHWSLFAGTPALTLERILYAAYFASFVTMWAMYFLSRWAPKEGFLAVRTLRRLLLGTTEDWSVLADGYEKHKQETDKVKLAEMEKGFKDKSLASMTNLGMLIGAAALELGQLGTVRWHDGAKPTPWSELTLGLGTVCSITSLVCFIIAADSLDSIFNQFREPGERHVLIRHFYMQSVNPRYFGLVCLLLAATLMVAAVTPCLGAMSIAIILSVGFRHWFPGNVTVTSHPSLRGVYVALPLVLLPLAPRLLARHSPDALALVLNLLAWGAP